MLAARAVMVVLINLRRPPGVMTYWGDDQRPVGFYPAAGPRGGYLLVNVQLPDASSLERTEEVMARRSHSTRRR